uniref:Putative DNA binding, helix-turn-helix domain containing protein n=1 Tax=viral metagenome TaxID=1070528 RepID=A0A6M3LME7_9ZZZZ
MMQDMKIEHRYKLSEVAEILGVSHATVWRWCAAGKLAHIVLPSGQRQVLASEIERLLEPWPPNSAAPKTTE